MISYITRSRSGILPMYWPKGRISSAFGTQGMAEAISADSATAGIAGIVPLAIFHCVALAGLAVTNFTKSQAMAWFLLLGETVRPQPESATKTGSTWMPGRET